MPTGHCNYPHHHSGPTVGPPAGLIVAIVVGALVIYEWHALVVVFAVVAALAIAAVAVAVLWHSHTSEPYDAAYSERYELPGADRWDVSAEVLPRSDAALRRRVDQLERQLAERQERPAITGPRTVHQHVHLHGVTAEERAALLRGQRHQSERAIE